jgi:hypothetical protein
MQQAYWYRTVFNGYEPDNNVRFTAELEGTIYTAFELHCNFVANDGCSVVSIHREKDASFSWVNGDRSGAAGSWAEAWENLPALITDPDHYQESEIFNL